MPDCKKPALQAIIRGRVALETVIHSDGWRGYDGLVDVSYAKRRLQKFNGVPARTFNLHLEECEWRFNTRSKNLYRELLRLLRQHPL